MFNGKMKAVTFSYDDGITQDKRLIKILNKYGLKGTFNLNSGVLGTAALLIREDVTVPFVHPRAEEVREIYKGHEIASHTLTHPALIHCDNDEIVRQIEEDRRALSEIAGYEVVGFVYPIGTSAIDERVIDVVRSKTGVKYARTSTSTHSFEPQADLIVFDPTVYHHCEWDKMFELAKEFIEMKPDTPKIFYIWGHTFEFDIHDDWDRFEQFCALISGKDDIFYGTNREVLLAE